MIDLTDDEIIKMYKKGYSIKYITNLLYRFKNKNSKPILLDGVMLFPAKIYKKDFCRNYVSEVIYHDLLNNCLSKFSRLGAAYIIDILGLLSEIKKQFNFSCQGLRACTQPEATFTTEIAIAYNHNCKQEYMDFT